MLRTSILSVSTALAVLICLLLLAGCRGEATSDLGGNVLLSSGGDAPAAPVVTQSPEETQNPEETKNPEETQSPEETENPEESEASDSQRPPKDVSGGGSENQAPEPQAESPKTESPEAESPETSHAATDSDAPQPQAEPPVPAPPVPRFPERIPLRLIQVAELPQPLALAVRPGEDALYVALREGQVVRLSVEGGGVDGAAVENFRQQTVLDISNRVVAHNELGLLGLTFSPDGERLYTSSTAQGEISELTEWALDADGSVRDDEGRQVLSLQQPYGNHNGGDITFGPHGYLYFAFGDGGGSGDPLRAGQDPSGWLGSVLRIDPRPPADEADDRPYSIPADNPYADGEQGAPEVWLWGVRNPWRISFDSATGDLWVADVGQDELEEITRLPDGGAGANLGWSAYEGSEPFRSQIEPDGHVRPTHEYRHGVDGRCSITGGYVYRGERIGGLTGVYLFSDYCDGVIRGFTSEAGEVSLGLTTPDGVTSFGQGPEGEIYVMTTKALWRLEAG